MICKQESSLEHLFVLVTLVFYWGASAATLLHAVSALLRCSDNWHWQMRREKDLANALL